MFYINRAKGAFSLSIIVIIAISFFSVFVNAEETPPLCDEKILIIHSYHKGLAWTDGQDKGIRETLKSQENIEIFTEYLDTKRIALEKISDHFAKYIEQKYVTTKFDAIIVTDNNALSFVSQYYSKLFQGTPVVFSGINNFQPDMLKEFNGLATGVVQILDPKGTFDLIRKLQPELERLAVVSGTTPTAQAIRDEVKNELAMLEETQPILWLDGLNTDDLLGKLEKLTKNDAVLLCNFNRDREGLYYSHEKSGRMISKTSNAPVYAMEDHYLGTGVTGGYMNSSKDQGVVAGTICLDILDTGNIPEVVMTSPNLIMFDYNAMLRFGLDISTLPHSAVIINRSVSHYKQYKTLIWNTVMVFCLLLLALFGVSFGLMRVRSAKREIAHSEENLRITLNSIDDAVIAVDTEGCVVRMNPVAERLTGWEFVDAKNRPLSDVFNVFDARTKEPVVDPVKRLLEIGQIATLAKHTMLIAKDGARYQIADSAAPISNADGNVIGVVLVFRDVTDEYLMQKELLCSVERLRILFERAADAIFVSRLDGKLVQINNEACRSIGYTKEELLGLNVSDINAEMTTPEAFREFSKTLSHGQPVTIESSHRRKDGSVYPVEVTISCLDTPDGPDVLAIVHDITERKQTEKALQESENLFRDFFENAPIGFHILGPDRTIIDINDAELEMIGYSREEIVGKKTWSDLVIPALAEQFKKHWNDMKINGSVRNLEYTLIHKQGNHIDVILNASSRFDADGELINTRGSVLNVTERNQARHEIENSRNFLQKVIDAIPDEIIVIDPDYHISLANQAVRQNKKADPVPNHMTCYQLLHHRDSPCNGYDHKCPLREAIKTKKPATAIHIHCDATGNNIFNEINSSPVFNDSGEVIHVIESSRNITERMQAQEALNESEKKYRTLFEQSADATLVIDEDKFIDCNQATLDMLGYATKNELFQTHPSQLSPEFQPDGKSSFEKANEMMSIAFERGSHRFEWDHKRSNGEVFPVEVLLTDIELADRKFLYVIWRDITDRKKSESRLRSERVFTNAIIKALPDLFYIFEKNSIRFVRRNDNWSKITGYSEEELDKMTALDFFEEGHERDLCSECMQEVYNSGSSPMENFLVTKLGKKIPYYFTGERLVIDGQTYLVGLGLDITDRKRAEQQREQNRHYLQRAQEIGHLGTWELDVINNELVWTDENYRIFGIEPGTDLNYERFLECVYPDDRQYLKARWTQAINNDAPYDIEHRILVDNQVKWVREKAELEFDDKGKCIRGTGFTQDITDRKRAEETLRLNESRLEALIALGQMSCDSLSDIIDFALEEAVKLTGSTMGYLSFVNDDETVLTMHSWSKTGMAECHITAKPSMYPVDSTGLWGEVVRQRKPIITNDYASPNPFKKGHPKEHVCIVRHMNVPVFDGDKIVAVAGVGNKDNEYDKADVRQLTLLMEGMWRLVQRKMADEQREELVKRLGYKNRELQDIVYTASHDLRSPLVNIEGFSGELESDCNHLMELLEEQADGNDKREQIKPLIKEEIPQSLSFIKSGAKKMSSLLDGLLQISRVGTVEIHSESLDIEKTVREILTSMQHQINESNITVTVDSLPRCTGDTHMLDHVFTNLFSNAIKYRDQKKEGTIRISGKIENHMSIYCVQDNGIGIASGHQKKVFEIFHRLDPEGSAKGEGLGLTIVTRIMDRLGGKIWLESEPGKGSKFFIALPTV